MPLYRKKTTPIFAEQFDGVRRIDGVVISPVLEYTKENPTGVYGQIDTPDGVMTCIVGDWILTDAKGGRYPCKPSLFEATYERAPEGFGSQLFTFGDALACLKNGYPVARTGWNGKGMWILFTPGGVISANNAKLTPSACAIHRQAILDGELVTLDPHIDMRTAAGTVAVGWQPTQADMLASDWFVVPLDGPEISRQ